MRHPCNLVAAALLNEGLALPGQILVLLTGILPALLYVTGLFRWLKMCQAHKQRVFRSHAKSSKRCGRKASSEKIRLRGIWRFQYSSRREPNTVIGAPGNTASDPLELVK